jgi:hypothetical protein
MKLDDTQRSRVATWIQEGSKLSDIQNRIGSEFGLRLTYMEVRFLVDDLKLTPKDTEPPKTSTSLNPPSSPTPPAPPTAPIDLQPSNVPNETVPATGNVSVSVDQLTKPGAMVSGKVTFSDGNKADWYFDQMGRLGLSPQQPGYRPPQADLQQFQMALESELSKMGY